MVCSNIVINDKRARADVDIIVYFASPVAAAPAFGLLLCASCSVVLPSFDLRVSQNVTRVALVV